MPVSKISAKGQITLPSRLRRKLGIRPHDRVVIESVDDAIVIRRMVDIFELEGFLGKSLTEEEERKRMMEGATAHIEGSQ